MQRLQMCMSMNGGNTMQRESYHNYIKRKLRETKMNDTAIDYKFKEDQLISEFQSYINETYTGHYSQSKFQSTEVIIERGHGTGFCMGNVDKYSNRYGKKGSRADARKDLMKVLHYALIQLYIHDTEDDKIVQIMDSI